MSQTTLDRARAGDDGRVPRARRAVPARAAAALLPDPRLADRRRGPAAGDADRGLARAGPGSRGARRCAPGCTGSRPTAASTRCATPAGGSRPRRCRRSSRRSRAGAARSPGWSRTRTRCWSSCPTRARPGGAVRDHARRSSWRSSPRCSGCRRARPPILVLRDVLGYPTAEVAGMLAPPDRRQGRPAAGPRRARRAARRRRARHPRPAPPASGAGPALRRGVHRRDIDAARRAAHRRRLAAACRRPRTSTTARRRSPRSCGRAAPGAAPGGCRLVPTRANTQPAFGCLPRRADGGAPARPG